MGRTPRGQTRERVYKYVRKRLQAGEPPTVREVQRHFGFRAVQTARQHLEALVGEGRLKVVRGRSRGYRLPAGADAEAGGVVSRVVGSGEARAEQRLVTRGGLSLSSDGAVGWREARADGQRGAEGRSEVGGHSEADGELEQTRYARLVPLLGRVAAGHLTTAVEDLEGYLPVVDRPESDELFALRVRGESMVGAGILPGDVVIVRRQSVAEQGDIVVALVGDETTVKRLRRRGGRWELHAENPLFEPLKPETLSLLGKVVEVRRML